MHWLSKRRLTRALAVVALGIGMSGHAAPVAADSKEVVVFAAASMKNALDDVNGAWQRETGKRVKISYAASSALARQIEQGAPADVFISADLDWMDYLERHSQIKPATRGNLLANRLVLIAGRDSTTTAKIGPGFDLAGLLGHGRLAMANTDAVPAGKYGKTALIALGVWLGVQGKIAQAVNVRAALLLVSRGEAPLGIVYRTDAAADPNVRILDVFPEGTHPPVVYPVALTASSANPDAAVFLDFMKSNVAKPLFERQGFAVID